MRTTVLAALVVAMTLGAGSARAAIVYTNHTESHVGAFALAPRTYAGQPRSASVSLPQLDPSTLGALGVLDSVVINVAYHIDTFASVRNNTGYEPVDNLVGAIIVDAHNNVAAPGVSGSFGPLLGIGVGDWLNIVINVNSLLHLPVTASGNVNSNLTADAAYHGAYIGTGNVAASVTMQGWQIFPNFFASGSVLNMEWFGNQSTSGTLSVSYFYRTGIEETTEVPEPVSLSLLALGCGALAAARRRHRAR